MLIALPLTSVAALPGLTKAINESSVLWVNDLMPEAAQGLPGTAQSARRIRLPSILAPFQEAPVRQINPPDPALQNSAVVQKRAVKS